MTSFSAVLVAALQYILLIYIFKKPELTGCGPLLSALMVLLSVALVLWTLDPYPDRLRKMVCCHWIAEYLISVFVIEYAMGIFWFPLETAVLAFLPIVAFVFEETLMWIDSACHVPCDFFDFLRTEGMGMFISYLLSFLILVAALHATRIIDLRLLTRPNGVYAFFDDIHRRFRNSLKKLGLPKMFKARSRRLKRSDYCADEENSDDSEDVRGGFPSADEDCNDYEY